ncbi:glutathione S-transferase [Acinetobacter soli]|uniref:glutathione S-transferase n=1 Tax=Acinetobacter soli TaxID=487316 RepID=UPI000E6AB10A|nr:glutathione S-transferase [Acinetobacter soli]MBO3641012.1 glutathione S-transferase [Acinetobacter soli]MBO3672694.1 glutathione S-transferase [Acinetobacter soli]MBU3120586.1 glutathione S-transferase [Acinetobacter soli]WEH88341.1 glutathione S-transferase [Acinetobacter soli]WEI09765.1 glutathione S-transferase [Acinetobacter soli]
MLTIHHLEKSRSFRIVWALEELQQQYQIKLYKRLPSLAAPPELKRVHPLGKAPILEDAGRTIAESAVILEYLQTKFDTTQRFKPQQDDDAFQYLYWMHYAEGSLMPLLVFQLVMNNVGKNVPFFIRPVANKITDGVKAGFIGPRLKDHIAFIEQYLSEHDYFAGEFSFADIQMSFPLNALLTRTTGQFPNIRAFLKRIEMRPAYQRAKEKGDY